MQINRQRWLPPSDFTDPLLGALPPAMRVTSTGLRLYVDDEGRAEVRLRKMLAEIFEHDESVTERDLEEHLLRLDDINWLRLYVDRFGRSLLQVRVWPAVQHPEPSDFDAPPGFMKPSRRSQETFTVEERGRAGEGAGARESAGERARAGASERPSRTAHEPELPEPPSPFCSQHQPWGTEDPCGPCGTAALARKIWDRAAASVALPTPATRPRSVEPPVDPVEFIDDEGRIDCT